MLYDYLGLTDTIGPMSMPLSVVINAQARSNAGLGGIESGLIGLVSALGQLKDGQEEYIIITSWRDPDWLSSYLGPNQRIVSGPQQSHSKPRKPGLLDPFKRALGPLRPLVRAIWRELFPVPAPQPLRLFPEASISDGFYESLGCDVIHFPFQHFVLCALPTIYNPHDLQHLHYPQFFKPCEIAWREMVYRTGCHLANSVAVGSHWTKQDVVRHYRLDPDKVQVIPWAPATQVYPAPSASTLATVKKKYQLQLPFAYYPSMTWEHKNHLRLLEALAYLRDRRGLIVRLVCTGDRFPDFWPRIEERLRTLNLADQVQFLDMLPPSDLRSIYRLAQFVVVPTLFEAVSGPIFEAWQEGVPVACSKVTSLPEQAGDAALLFDPFSVEAIADAVRRMATDKQLRAKLARKGKQRLNHFSWKRTAKAYRALYRRAARRPLTDEDLWLLNWDWMRNPRPPEEGTS
jgi:glycosyltransferase involved in cell wall biosynthesis